MNNEEKILSILSQMQGDLTQVKDDLTQVKVTQAQMQDDLTHVKARLDYDVEKRFDAMNDGIDTILQTMSPKSRMDALEDEMVFMKSVIKSMSQRLTELEKAQ